MSLSPLETAITRLNESIALSTDQSDEMNRNENTFRDQISNGLNSISEKVAQILGLINQIDNLIANLQRQIAELEARQMPDPNPELQRLIEQLEQQVRNLQQQQDIAFDAINRANQHIDDTRMSMEQNARKPDLSPVLDTINRNLDAIINSLNGTISSNPLSNPANVAQNPLSDATDIKLNSGTLTYGELKSALAAKLAQLKRDTGSIPSRYEDFNRVVNAINSTADDIEQSARTHSINFDGSVLRGGRRRRRTRKLSPKKKSRKSRRKNRRTRKTRQRRKQRGGYTYSEPSSSSERKGRGFIKKSSKKC